MGGKNSGSLKNFKGKQHTLTREDQVKGGKSRSPFKVFRLRLNRRSKCNARCRWFPCVFQPLTISKNPKFRKYKGLCALRMQPPVTIQQYYEMIVSGTEGDFLKVMNKGLMRLSIKGNDKDLLTYGEKLFRMKFGDKSRIEARLNPYDEVVKSLQLEKEDDEK